MIASDRWEDDELATLGPGEDGTHQVISDSIGGVGESRASGSDEDAGHRRQVVFLKARALFGGERRRLHR
jgi:hypothetical protein